VPWVWFTCLAGIASCIALLFYMSWYNWALMGAWTLIGLAIYGAYGYRHSRLKHGSQNV
jgi:APA family basic amino acid/polyamine antiporter